MKEVSIQRVLSVTEEIGTGVHDLFSTGIEYVPYLGKFIRNVKFNRLERRMKEHSYILCFNNFSLIDSD
ncbi:hypothetical protein ACFQZ1_23205 [Bacillus sp. CGMCC 1.60114]|uniref:hypothetical protein n=1 Tax=unclassified Bacillus (in: firmicutes) TaxID=185979 RepID=UPI00362E9C31